MIETLISDKQIVGVYDAPLRSRNPDSQVIQISSLAMTLGDQIKQKFDTLNSVIVLLRVNDEEENDDVKTREITSDDDSEDPLIVTAYSCQSTVQTKKVKLVCVECPERVAGNLTKS